jgi:hypothetical protein
MEFIYEILTGGKPTYMNTNGKKLKYAEEHSFELDKSADCVNMYKCSRCGMKTWYIDDTFYAMGDYARHCKRKGGGFEFL